MQEALELLLDGGDVERVIQQLPSATVTLEASTDATPRRYQPTFGATPGGPAVGPGRRTDLPARPTVTVEATSPGFQRQTATSTVSRVAGAVTSMTPATDLVLQALRPGHARGAAGHGLLPGSRVEFGNEHATAEIVGGDPAASRIQSRVPRLATAGQVTVVSPDGESISEDSFTVISPRNSEGSRSTTPTIPPSTSGSSRSSFGKETNVSHGCRRSGHGSRSADPPTPTAP